MKKILTIAGGLALSLASGAAGYFLARKQLQDKYDQILEDEIEATKEHYEVIAKMRLKGEGFETAEEAAQTLGRSVVEDPRPAVEKMIAGFGYGVPGIVSKPDPDAEEEHDGPYDLTAAEYFAGEMNHSQVSLSYFSGDGVLCDDSDMPLVDIDETIGEANLELFGKKSGDKRVLYVRNERLGIDYEIVKSDGKYSKAIAGFDDEEEARRR